MEDRGTEVSVVVQEDETESGERTKNQLRSATMKDKREGEDSRCIALGVAAFTVSTLTVSQAKRASKSGSPTKEVGGFKASVLAESRRELNQQ